MTGDSQPAAPEMGPVGPEMGPVGPEMGPVGPEMGPVGPEMSPVGPEMGPVDPARRCSGRGGQPPAPGLACPVTSRPRYFSMFSADSRIPMMRCAVANRLSRSAAAAPSRSPAATSSATRAFCST